MSQSNSKITSKLTLLASLTLTALALALPAQASEVSLTGRVYSSTNCSYYSSSLGEFAVKYSNMEIPYGAEVTVHYGFHDTFNKNDWKSLGSTTMNATGPYAWEAKLPVSVVDSRSYFAYDKIQFYFEIRKSFDNTSTYDNGGSSTHRYEAMLPFHACGPEAFEALQVEVK